MTGYTVHTGSTEQFSDGWDRIFGGKPKPGSKPKKKATKKTESARRPAASKKDSSSTK